MKIFSNRIPPEGCAFTESIDSAILDLEVESIKFRGPLLVEAELFKVTNAVSVELKVTGSTLVSCNRCLKEFAQPFSKTMKFNYATTRADEVIELNDDIREEIILDYPIKFLCDQDCKGLCPGCGQDLNLGKCKCLPKDNN